MKDYLLITLLMINKRKIDACLQLFNYKLIIIIRMG